MSAFSASVPETSISVETTLPLIAPDGPMRIDWAVTSPSTTPSTIMASGNGSLHRHACTDIGDIRCSQPKSVDRHWPHSPRL